MRYFPLLLVATLAMVSILGAQDAPVAPTEIHGHFIGESIAGFLRAEPEARQEAYVCGQHPDRPSCAHLLGALDHGQRAEISTSDSIDFTLDGGKLVKLSMLVDDSFDPAAKFGSRSQVSTIAAQNAQGAKWQNRLTEWDLADASVTLYEDHNPLRNDQRRLLIVQARPKNTQEYTVSVQRLAEKELGSNTAPAR